MEFAGEVSTVLAYKSSNASTKEIKDGRHTPAFVPSTASADAPDIVRYRFDTTRNDGNALGAELIFSCVAAAKKGVGVGIGEGGGCGGAVGIVVWAAFGFFSFEGVVATLESES